MKERQRIETSDLDSLFPGDSLTIGASQILITPLSISQISILSKRLKGIGKLLFEEGVTWDNYTEKDSLFKITVILLENLPDVLAEASNVHEDDLKMLPIESIVSIVTKVIEVNLKSKDILEKNFKSLAEILNQNVPEEPKIQKGKPKIKK